MKNAVVFGATGQLGCYSAIALKEDGYNVYGNPVKAKLYIGSLARVGLPT